MSDEKQEIISRRLANARKSFAEVDILVENALWNVSINRIYYSCFYCVSTLLFNDGLDSKTHSGVQRLFSQHYIKSGLIKDEYGKLFATLMDMRQKADYEFEIEYEKSDVINVLGPAEELISVIEAMLLIK